MTEQMQLPIDEGELSPEARVRLLEKEWNNHKFRKGEYFDRYLYKLLRKYDLSLSEYYRFGDKSKD